MLTRSRFEKQMTKPRKRKVKSDYLAGLSGKERAARKAALLKLNKNTKGSGILPGDLNKKGKLKGSKKQSPHNERFRKKYG
jgi:hypothetical protein